MNDFRLIALRPLEGCNPKYLKKLKTNFLFKFSSNFQITEDDILNPKERKLKFNSQLPNGLYDLNLEYLQHTNKIPVNVSAIVGKNGSGKSTLIELFFAAIFNFSVEKGIIKSKSEREEEENAQPSEYEPNIKIEIFYQMGEYIYCLRIENGTKTNSTQKVSTLYKYYLEKNDIWIYKETVKSDFKHHLKHFFYTIAINYSIYGLNSDLVGNWIESLFHKNDSYQTPIVINPMRTRGNIDMKKENDLVNQRLLSNILQPISNDNENGTKSILENSLRNLAPGKNVEFLKLTFNPIKAKKYAAYTKEVTNNELFTAFSSFYLKYTGNQIFQARPETEQWSLMNYIMFKLKKICSKYQLYYKYLDRGKLTNTDKLIDDLLKDKSHVTFKLKQAVNLICYYERIQETKEVNGLINIAKYSRFIQETINSRKESDKNIQVIELIPPAIYEIEILFGNDGHSFDDFSSGEKQKVHSINSILYHLINLNSVFGNENHIDGDIDSLNRYQHVNIIFDEIELYFHPDLQRLFVYDLLQSMSKMNPLHLWHFAGIQLLFVTHSPFILSDIPSKNILYLKADEKSGEITSIESKGETFGGNIHDLLAHDFFMKNGFMGELAKTKIQFAISHLQNLIKNPKEESTFTEWDAESIKALIDIIGEPMIKKSILDLYMIAYGNNAIEAEIVRLTHILNEQKRTN
ncbi:AAA family ATPase [Pedobacter mucosus]|uniref:AAA family ATPase n=1 Tax=Pedobacter mucosus TaxID=2895286 RepID=UPI001EE4BAFD|nr:AAA family ATPase [Pedobacter mucosus]UKT65455.1 AAA family ATPase [Pedobacter mucosus]